MMFLLLGCNAAQANPKADCENLVNQAQQLARNNKVDELKERYKELVSCGAKSIEYVGMLTATSLWNQLLQKAGQSEDPTPFELDLREIITYGQVWQAHELLGDIANKRQLHVVATDYYQAALVAIDDSEWTPNPPDSQYIGHLYKKAETQRLLAGEFISSARSRNGKAAGLGANRVRSFTATKSAIPVQFDFGTAKLTADGLKAAEDIWSILSETPTAAITLVGHTDPIGSDKTNNALSMQRAEALASFLKSKGYKGKINTVGKGRAQPFEPDNPNAYSTDQKHQMDRRVELVRNP